jgi:hypothetical protein
MKTAHSSMEPMPRFSIRRLDSALNTDPPRLIQNMDETCGRRPSDAPTMAQIPGLGDDFVQCLRDDSVDSDERLNAAMRDEIRRPSWRHSLSFAQRWGKKKPYHMVCRIGAPDSGWPFPMLVMGVYPKHRTERVLQVAAEDHLELLHATAGNFGQ